MADVRVSKSELHGFGVFAERDFEEGETIIVMDDSRVVDANNPLRPELGEFEYHCDYLADGKIILQDIPERYINSSCDPNAYSRRDENGSRVIARRQIRAGEEITYDYIIDCYNGAIWQCNCGSARCRKTIVASFFDLPLTLQVEYLPLLNEWFINEHKDKVDALRKIV
jgi:SET domain-containing protein